MAAIPVVINLEAMIPGLGHQLMRIILHVCGLRDISSQTQLIEYEGLETVEEELANNTDSELDFQWPIATLTVLRPVRES